MTVMNYRTEDGLATYGFSIEFQPEAGWRIYIVFRPLCHRDNSEWPYQATDDDGRSYVDWTAKLDSLGDAKDVAKSWAEMIENCTWEVTRGGHAVAKAPSAKKRRRSAAA